MEYFRVFNQCSFDRGGRLYGPYWQNLSKAQRAYLTIDGEDVVELDYANLHPRILYMQSGQPFNGEDVYALEGEWTRGQVKVAFLIIINAKSHKGAWGAIVRETGLSKDAARDLIRAIKACHPQIKHVFHSNCGVELMNIDSHLVLRVLRRMRRKGIVVLPIHASFIAAKRHEEELRTSMDLATMAVLKTTIPIG